MTAPTARVTMLVRNTFTHDSRVEKEARSLVRAGYHVTVVAEGGAGLAEREHRDGYDVVRVPRGPATLPGLRMREYRTRLVSALSATTPDILHAHDSDALGAVARVAGSRGAPFVYDAHELWLGQENRGRTRLYHALFRAYYWWMQRRLVPRAAAVLTVSEPIADRLESTYGVPVSLVPNFPEFSKPPRRRDLRGLLSEPIPESAPVILYVGSIQVGRGLTELVTALAEVPDAHLVCLGVTDAPTELLALAEESGVLARTRFVAPVPGDEVVDFATSATVGVALATPISLNNRLSLPNKLFQYMAAGIPVVANDLPHMRSIVEGSGAGLCVDPTRPAEIAGAIRRILADPDAAAAMGARGASAVRERYNWSVSERVLLDVYERITASLAA